MRFVVVVHSQQKGFLIALGKLLAREHQVGFLAGDTDAAGIIRRHIPDAEIMIEGQGERGTGADVIKRAREIEKTYDVRLSMLMSHDRALGRGYLFNADRYPQVGKAWWSGERKLMEMVARFEDAEALLDRFKPDCVISLQKDTVRFIVASSRGVMSYSPAPVKIGERFIWSDDLFLTNSSFLKAVGDNLNRPAGQLYNISEYAQEAGSKLNHSMVRYTWARALELSWRQIQVEAYSLIRGTRKKDSYPFLGWVPVIWRRTMMYRYFERYGVKPGQLAGRRICYVPLHLEPEIALLSISPEFNNSLEMIVWISKAAPAEIVLVVKEQPFSFGVRSRWYYDQLRQISNVVLAHPRATSWEWIDTASLVATITGTVGTEAVIFKKPVLSYGAHQAVNLLPTVRFADNYGSTRKGLDELLAMKPDDPKFELSRKALYTAQMDTSFELPGFSGTYKSSELEEDTARIALNALTEHIEALKDGLSDDQR